MAKTTQIQLRATPEEKEKLSAAATAAGLPMSEFIMQAALARADDARLGLGKPTIYAKIDEREIEIGELLRVPVTARFEEPTKKPKRGTK